MEMSPLQIASEYRTGKDKTKTIKVLAELNAVTQRTIAQLLADQGEELPGHWKAKLEAGLKTKPVSDRYLKEAIVEAVTPGPGDPSTPALRASAQDDNAKEERIATAACALPRNDNAALSADRDPASRAGRINWQQYSRLMRIIGRLEGGLWSISLGPNAKVSEVLEDLFKLADEIKPEVPR